MNNIFHRKITSVCIECTIVLSFEVFICEHYRNVMNLYLFTLKSPSQNQEELCYHCCSFSLCFIFLIGLLIHRVQTLWRIYLCTVMFMTKHHSFLSEFSKHKSSWSFLLFSHNQWVSGTSRSPHVRRHWCKTFLIFRLLSNHCRFSSKLCVWMFFRWTYTKFVIIEVLPIFLMELCINLCNF